jgi:hypothetical protein
MFVEYDTLCRQYSISALMKRDNITEMHIYVKYEIVSFMRRQFSSRDLHKDCWHYRAKYVGNDNDRYFLVLIL